MKEKCEECLGTGIWECDEDGNMYDKPKKCEICNGSGYVIKEC